MRCKKHLTDCSSAVGVCASCLRERLLTIIERQTRYEAQVLLVTPQLEDEYRKSDAVQQHITFPKSVSPYISGRKSDTTAAWPHLPQSHAEQRFYSTPEIGPNGIIMTSSLRESRAGKFHFSSLSNLFRSKTSKFEKESDSNFDARTKHKKSYSINSMATETQQTKPSSSWFTNLFASKKKRNSHIVSMSFPDEYEYSSETSQNTPMRVTPQRRKQNQGRNVAGISFCLSPLVRPSPKRSWNQKAVLPEIMMQGGEMKVSPARPNLGVAASFTGNRSRKLANFGRFYPNY